MLLDNLLKPCVIQLRELGQIMHISNDIAQIFFQQHEVILRGHIIFGQPGVPILRGPGTSLIQSRNHIVDLLFASFDPSYDLPRFDPLEREYFVKLTFELGNEGFFVIFVPLSPLGFRILLCRFALGRKLESVFELVIGDIVVLVFFQQ